MAPIPVIVHITKTRNWIFRLCFILRAARNLRRQWASLLSSFSPSGSRLYRKGNKGINQSSVPSLPSGQVVSWSLQFMVLVFFSLSAPLQSWGRVCKHQGHIPLELILLKRSRLEVNSVQTNHQQCVCTDPFPQKSVK